MSITDEQINDMIRRASYRTFTLLEACEFQRTIDNYSTTRHSLSWKDVRTGKPVSIGYTGY